MKEGLATKKTPDPHEWSIVEVDICVRGTAIVVSQIGKGWLCKRCHTFALLAVDKWNPFYPDMFPCEVKDNALAGERLELLALRQSVGGLSG